MAAKEPNITVLEANVDGLVKSEGSDQVLGVTSRTDGKSVCFFAPLTIVADGYRSKFRGEISSRKPVIKSRFWALELRDAELPSPGFGHVLLGSFSPVLVYQIGTRETRALINIPETQSARSANGEPAALLHQGLRGNAGRWGKYRRPPRPPVVLHIRVFVATASIAKKRQPFEFLHPLKVHTKFP